MTIIEYLKNEETKNKIINIINKNIFIYKTISTETKLNYFVKIIYNKFMYECVKNNQYVAFSNKSMDKINNIYKNLAINLINISKRNELNEVENVVTNHRLNLIKELMISDCDDRNNWGHSLCFEYSKELQRAILRLNFFHLMEPIMDIGCGENAALIKFLRNNNYRDVFGLDQYESNDSSILRCNWFEYKFCKNTFGTIISHMAFTNHFRRSISNKNSNKYFEKYFEILDSLIVGGLFIYSPAIREVESKISFEKYAIYYFKNIADRNFDTVAIRKRA